MSVGMSVVGPQGDSSGVEAGALADGGGLMPADGCFIFEGCFGGMSFPTFTPSPNSVGDVVLYVVTCVIFVACFTWEAEN